MLYLLLTGRYPFRAATTMAIERQHLEMQPLRPSQISLTPLALDAITLRCMEKEADRRFRSAKALADALHEAIDAQKVTN